MYNVPSTIYNSTMRKGTNTSRAAKLYIVDGKWEI